MPEDPKPNCYDCKHRRELPGNAHSRCAHPDIPVTSVDELSSLLGIGTQTPQIVAAARDLNVRGNPIGIRRAWFIWPYNFDPVWLQSCNGFESRESVE